MLRLDSSAPVTVDLADGAKVVLDAPSPRVIVAGRRAVRKALDDNADLDSDIAALVFTEGVLAAAITRWSGIGDADGKALPCTPETVALALKDPHIFGLLERKYAHPITLRELEKNASAASSAGTSARATAGNGTANSRAATKRKPATKKRTSAKKT